MFKGKVKEVEVNHCFQCESPDDIVNFHSNYTDGSITYICAKCKRIEPIDERFRITPMNKIERYAEFVWYQGIKRGVDWYIKARDKIIKKKDQEIAREERAEKRKFDKIAKEIDEL